MCRAVTKLMVLGLLLVLPGVVAAQSRNGTSDPRGTGTRTYEGMLTCLLPDGTGPEVTITKCRETGRHERVLIMKHGNVHPLYGTNDELQAVIHADDMLGKTVKVKGTMYPITGAILVSEMTLNQ